MRKCTFEELTEKEVINCADGRRLGNVFDCVIDLECAKILSIKVESGGRFFCFDKNRDCIIIPWECIKKIGDDIILVEVILPPAPKPEKPKKRFFCE